MTGRHNVIALVIEGKPTSFVLFLGSSALDGKCFWEIKDGVGIYRVTDKGMVGILRRRRKTNRGKGKRMRGLKCGFLFKIKNIDLQERDPSSVNNRHHRLLSRSFFHFPSRA